MSGSGSPSRFVNPGGNTTSAPSYSMSSPASSRRSITSGHQRLVDALAGEVVIGEMHAEQLVHGVEVLGGELDEASTTGGVSRDRHPGAAPHVVGPGPGTPRTRSNAWRASCRSRRDRRARDARRHDSSPRSTRCSISMPNGRSPVADVVLADHTMAEEVEHPHERVADQRSSADGRRASPWPRSAPNSRSRRSSLAAAGATPSRSSAATSANWFARNSDDNVTLTKPGPATPDRSPPGSSTPESTTRCAMSRGFDPMRFGKRERTVDLCVGPVGRSHGRIGGLATVELGEDRPEEVRDRGDGVRHGRTSLPDADHSLTGRSRTHPNRTAPGLSGRYRQRVRPGSLRIRRGEEEPEQDPE